MGDAEDVEGFAFQGRAGGGEEVSRRRFLFGCGADAVIRYAHIQSQAGEKGERPWAPFDIDVRLLHWKMELR